MDKNVELLMSKKRFMELSIEFRALSANRAAIAAPADGSTAAPAEETKYSQQMASSPSQVRDQSLDFGLHMQLIDTDMQIQKVQAKCRRAIA
jgi:hypothetical protein